MSSMISGIRPSQIARLLEIDYRSRQPIMIWGSPGVGKTQIVGQVAERLGLPCHRVVLPQIEATDLRGVLYTTEVKKGTKRSGYAPPSWLPFESPALLYLDELDKCRPDVEGAALELLDSHSVAGQALHPDSWVVATGNSMGTRAGGGQRRLGDAILSRLGHYDLEVSAEDWLGWAAGACIDPTVRGLINWKPDLLFVHDANRTDRSFPCPRTWERVSKNIAGVDDEATIYFLASKWIGSGAAAELRAFRQTYGKLPDIDRLLKNPASVADIDEPSIIFALWSALAERLRNKPEILAQATEVAISAAPEWAVKGMQELRRVTNTETFTKNPNPRFREWLRKNMAIFEGTK